MNRTLRYMVGAVATAALVCAAVLIGSPADSLDVAAYVAPTMLLAGVMANSIPEQFKVVQMAFPQTTNGGFTSDIISMKNAHKATVIIDVNQAVGHATVFTLRQSDDVAGSNTAAWAAATARIWVNEDVAASDTLVKASNGSAETLTNDIKKKQIVFEFDATELADGNDCFYFTASDSSQATNFASAVVLLHTRYPQATPPAAISD